MVVLIAQTLENYDFANTPLQLFHKHYVFSFGDNSCRSLANMKLLFSSTSGHNTIISHVDHIPISLLLDLDALDHHGRNFLTV